MGHKSVPSIYFHCLGCVLEHFPVPRYIFLLNMASCHFGCFLPPKPPIFGPTWTWNGAWMGRKSVQHMYSHCLGCVLVHFPVSRWVIGLIWQPTIMVYFDQKMSHFWTPAHLKWYLEMASMAPSHLSICKTKILVHYEFKVHINVVGRAKNLQK